MSVPAISFILQLLVAMILHVDVLVALSTTTQILQNNQRNATDRQLRAQDSRAKIKVIDLYFDFLLHPGVRGQQGTSTSAGPSQLLIDDNAHIGYVTQCLTSLSETNKHTFDELIVDFEAARKSMGGPVPKNMVFPLDISKLRPNVQLIILCALMLRSQSGGRVINDIKWDTLLHHLIRYGFNRNEVTLILRTAKYTDGTLHQFIRQNRVCNDDRTDSECKALRRRN
ncbi:hypothetical protein Plhal304r1_c012g0046651 [Plasmopara halstedii]